MMISPNSPRGTSLPFSSTILNVASGIALPKEPLRLALKVLTQLTAIASVKPYPWNKRHLEPASAIVLLNLSSKSAGMESPPQKQQCKYFKFLDLTNFGSCSNFS